MEDCCLICGDIIPEGRQICPVCERSNDRLTDERRMMVQLLRHSVWKESPAYSQETIPKLFAGETVKSHGIITNKAARTAQCGTAFRQFFNWLGAFFISWKMRRQCEPNNYRPGQSKGRCRENDDLLQLRRRTGAGRKKGAPG